MATYNLRAGLSPVNVGVIFIDSLRTLDLNRQFTESATMYAPNADTGAVRVLDTLQGSVLTKITDNPAANEARYLTPVLALVPFTPAANQDIKRRTADGLFEVSTVGSGPPSGAAGGALAGTYPNPSLSTTPILSGGAAGGALTGTYPNPGLAVSPVAVGAAAGGALAGTYPNPTLAVGGPTIATVATLPTSGLYDDYTVYYQTAAMAALGVRWQFAYVPGSANSSKWECVGGGDMMVGPSGNVTTAATTEAALPSGPSLVVPLTGTYRVELRMFMQAQAAGLLGMNGKIAVNGVSSAVTSLYAVTGATFDGGAFSTFSKPVFTAGDTLTVFQKNDQAVSCNYGQAQIGLRPIMVG